ncbi:hypothetical protein D3C76_882540 [compost metagenome]
MKTLVIIFLAVLLITGADVRPVFIHMFRALSYAAESSLSSAPLKQRVAEPVEMPEEPAPKAVDLPFLESPTASTIKDLSLDEAIDQATSIQTGRESKNN